MLSLLTPHHRRDSIHDITPEWLLSVGVAGALVDLDCTLVDFRAGECPARAMEWVERMRHAGIALCIVSNSGRERVAPIADQLGLPFICRARKPLPAGLRRGLRKLGLPSHAVAMIGDQLTTDVLGGRLQGALTILVQPTSRDEAWITRWKRPFERLVLRALP